jgi:hypothetical protein
MAMPPFSVGGFCATNPVELCELLVPHLDAYDLGALARVARTFRAWPANSRRRCRLGTRHKFEFKHLGAKPVMVAYREIRMDLFVSERYTNATGNHWRREIAPAALVDLEDSLVDVELVCERTGRAVERLLEDKLFKKCRARPKKNQQPVQSYKWRTLRFKINETLSSNHPAPGRFFLRTTARVARLAGKDYGTYVHNSPPFYVVSPWAMPKEGSEAALAREQDPSRHGWRGRYV